MPGPVWQTERAGLVQGQGHGSLMGEEPGACRRARWAQKKAVFLDTVRLKIAKQGWDSRP